GAVRGLVGIAGERRGYSRPVAEIEVRKGDAAASMVQRGVASASQFGKGATARGNDRRVVGAGHGDDDVLRREAAVVVVDLHRVSQRDGFGIGKIVEIMVWSPERPFLVASQA